MCRKSCAVPYRSTGYKYVDNGVFLFVCFLFLDNVVKTKSMDVNRNLFSKLFFPSVFSSFFKAVRRTLVKYSSVLNNLKKKKKQSSYNLTFSVLTLMYYM